MKRHAAILGPKFRCVVEGLDREIAPLGIASPGAVPRGGYFVSLNAMPGTAKRTLALCKEAGVTMTGAGATFPPTAKDPADSNIRIAPSLPPGGGAGAGGGGAVHLPETGGTGEAGRMRYFGSVYRPPSEAYSLIVQVTYGCSHNTCAFCSMYKGKALCCPAPEEVLEDFRIARGIYRHVGAGIPGGRRRSGAQGRGAVRHPWTPCGSCSPECQRVTCYASPTSIRIRTDEELRTLRAKGLTMVYMGLESGATRCSRSCARVTPQRTSWPWVRRSAKTASPSPSRPSPAWAPALLERHAVETAEAFNAMNPEYIGMLTLMVEPGTPLYDWLHDGSFQLLSQPQVLQETRLLMEHLDSPGSVFRMNHASNYLVLKGTLNQDKGRHAADHRRGRARPQPSPAGGVAGPLSLCEKKNASGKTGSSRRRFLRYWVICLKLPRVSLTLET